MMTISVITNNQSTALDLCTIIIASEVPLYGINSLTSLLWSWSFVKTVYRDIWTQNCFVTFYFSICPDNMFGEIIIMVFISIVLHSLNATATCFS